MFLILVLCFLGMLMKSTHLLSFLISLEFIALFVLFFFMLLQVSVFSVLLVFFFLLGAMGCESALGLVLFVLLTRFSSKDYLMQTSLLKF